MIPVVIPLPVWVEHRRECCRACERPTHRGTDAKAGKVLLTSRCEGRTIREIYEDPSEACPLQEFTHFDGQAGQIVVKRGVIAGWIDGIATTPPLSEFMSRQRRGGCGSC